MMCDNIRKRKECLFRSEPAEWTHREVIILSVPDSKLLLAVVEGKELVRGVEVFVIFAVAALYFAVVPWCERLNEFVLNTKTLKRYLEKSLFVRTL